MFLRLSLLRDRFLWILLLVLMSIYGLIRIKSLLENEENQILETSFLILQIVLASCILFFILDKSFQIWKEYRKLKSDKAKAELSNLRNQISPHFFFNTLNNLYGLIAKDTVSAREFVLKLSELMRYSIYTGSNDKVSISEEVDYLSNFIDLQEIRYHKTMNISFETDIQNNHFELPPLLLIVLLENAFKHGVEKMAEDIKVVAMLSTSRDQLVFEVENDYIKDESTPQGIGINNLKERLQLLYPKKHLLKINDNHNTFHVRLELYQ